MPLDPSECAFATKCTAVYDPKHVDQYGASSTPVYLTATFKGLPGAEYDYSRVSNPSRDVLEHHLSQIQGCKHTHAVSSGMACLDIIMRMIRPGDIVLAGDDLYGGSDRLLELYKKQMGIRVDNVDTTDLSAVEEVLARRAKEHAEGNGPRVALALLESPTNPMIKIADLPRCTSLVRQYAPEALVVVDNTMMSPYLMRPLDFGVDIVYDSATKYLCGHHDVLAGILACNSDDLSAKIHFTIKSVGNGLSPLDCFLLLRGVKTLALRMDRQQASAQEIANYLNRLGFKVRYPGLRSHPGHDVHARQAKGAGGVLSFETGNVQLSEKVVAAARLWGVSVSFGCVNSLITMPCQMSHASIDPRVRAERGLPENLIRLCLGIEDVNDLLRDLHQALLTAGAIREEPAGSGTFVRVPVDDEMEVLRRQLAPELAKPPAAPTTLTVSAPGKVILFGEHAVVHGVTAIAAATALRCYGHVKPSKTTQVTLSLPDIDLVHHWDILALPWLLCSNSTEAKELDMQLLSALSAIVSVAYPEGDRRHNASMAFLYLYMHLAQESSHGQIFELRSKLPISAGLGSSAAVSTCLATLMLYTHGHLPLPSPTEPMPKEHTARINAWAFMAEKVIHGEPSGVDNTVATLGGAVAFTRAVPSNGLSENRLVPISFDAVRLLITDTKVVRNTKELVASVTQQKAEDPVRVEAAFATIQMLADQAQALLSSTMPRKELVERLGMLMDLNHLQLVQLRVGHAALEDVRKATWAQGLRSKLTGAGGGGCAITLLHDQLSEKDVHSLTDTLHARGFATYETEVGGNGVGLLVHPSDTAPDLEALQTTDSHAWDQASGTWIYA
ncbi:cystathionine beta-lyase [Malassezia pachydermatis]|uniref:Cystathionine beta-lyase n=1 Tax=Malassezia pachydermatis TaxID=77020 RepID=A0A0M9VR79_9BASI|nr:cystathionine beta-lyase [Malassezia pachydermatis]KOS16339.1 cystathionine beta-lyase [Malassezia pachydermatis]